MHYCMLSSSWPVIAKASPYSLGMAAPPLVPLVPSIEDYSVGPVNKAKHIISKRRDRRSEPRT